jgi:hypothetical protein
MASSIDRDARNCGSVMSSEAKGGEAGGVGNASSARTLRTAQAAQIIPIAAHRLVVLNAMRGSLTQRARLPQPLG